MFDFGTFYPHLSKCIPSSIFLQNLKRISNMNQIMMRGKLVKSYTVILGLPARELIALSLVVG